MPDQLIKLTVDGALATLVLNDPAKRNALGVPMFDSLQSALERIATDESIHVVLLRGEGSALCAGFDLGAAQGDPALVAILIQRLSQVIRQLRRMPQVVVAAAHGAAIAGGCALLSGCDFVFVAADAKLGYPVHRLGISPAVTIPSLGQMVGGGAARSLLMSGELIDGTAARKIGLASHLSPDSRAALLDATAHCRRLLDKGPHALRVTKSWLNELDGSLDDSRFDRPASASASESKWEEARRLLSQWRA